ncbi:MAG: hypothetical protein ACRDHN_16215 [Thermomicrobiales bacterium]
MTESTNEVTPRIVLLNRDMFFGIRIRQVGVAIGYVVEITPKTDLFIERIAADDVALGVIDIAAIPDWEVLAGAIASGGLAPILAFGPHKDVDGLRGAKQAGVTRVVSNGDFHKDPAAMLKRYARSLATPNPTTSSS